MDADSKIGNEEKAMNIRAETEELDALYYSAAGPRGKRLEAAQERNLGQDYYYRRRRPKYL